MRIIRSKLDYVDTEYRVLAKLNGKIVGFIDKNLNGTYSYAFGRPKASYVSFNVDDLDTAKNRLEEHVFMGNSRRPVKSAFYVTCCDENDNDVGFVTEDKKVTENESKIKYFDSRKEAENFAKLMYDVYKEENEKYNFGYEFYVEEEPIESSRRPVKSGYEGDDAKAEELALYIKNTSELYHSITHSVIENLKKKARKGVYDKERAVDAWMYVADAGAKMYDKEFGSGRGSMTLFTKDERRKAAEELARYYDEDILEGLDNVQSAFRPIKSAVDGGWEVDSSDVPEALDLFVEYFGEEEALEAIAKAMSSDTLDENIEWIARHWGFAEELEGYDDSWDKYEYAKEVMGESQLFNELTSAAGYDELAEDLAYIFRMYDFREWDKYDDNDDEEIESSHRISSGKRTVDHKKPSREEIEKALDKKLAQQKVKFATDMYDDTVDYILSFWDEEDYIPKDADDAVSQWYNDTKKHFPQDLKKIASAAYRHWIRSKLIKSSRRVR